MVSEQSGIKLEINNRKIAGKIPRYLETNTFLHDTFIKEVLREMHFELKENKNIIYQNV